MPLKIELKYDYMNYLSNQTILYNKLQHLCETFTKICQPSLWRDRKYYGTTIFTLTFGFRGKGTNHVSYRPLGILYP